MKNVSEQANEFQHIYLSCNFNENDFVKMLLVLLFKMGVKRINENELKEKLNYYYNNPEYNKLFKEIYRRDMQENINIQNGLYIEKSGYGNVVWDMMNPNVLHLQYDRNVSLVELEDKLSTTALMLLNKMALELAIRNKVEKNGEHKVIIYGCDPNKSYTLVHGTNASNILSWELLTDGQIKMIDYIREGTLKPQFFDSPENSNCKVQLINNSIVRIKLRNASYSIMQGIKNGEIAYSKIFTDICDLDTLKQIRNMANTKCLDECNLLNKKKPYVRKLTLR